jgi:NHLM bacteriocin system ABC transporter peptidase/ATP-binding protein
MEATECGAAALGIVLAHYGKFVPLEELRQACGVSRDGSKANNMVRAARGYGLEAKGLKRQLARLADLKLPAILFWNFNHFLVLEGFGRGKVYLNDPAQGPRVVTVAELNQSFTGVVLTFEPGPGFEKSGHPSRMLPTLRQWLSRSRGPVAFAIVAGLALVVPGLVIPVFSRVFVDEVLMRGATDWTKPILIGMAITGALRAALTWLQRATLLRLETKLAVANSARFLWHVLRLPIDFFHQRYAGEIANRVQLNDRVSRLVSADLTSTAIDLVTVLFYLLVMLSYDPVLTTVGVALTALNAVALRLVSRRRTDESHKLQRAQGQLMGVSMGGLQAMETIKASGAEGEFFAHWAGVHAKSNEATQNLGVLGAYLNVVPTLLVALTSATILGVGAYRVMDGHLSIGMLVAFQSLMASFQGPVGKVVMMAGTLQEMGASLARIEDVFRYPIDQALQSVDAVRDDARVKLEGHVELRNVTFGYSRLDGPLIEGFNLVVKPGARVALVGSSGSGKSTVARLVCGLYEPWAGEILFDGKPRTAWPRSLLTSSIGVVDQDIVMFRASLRDNLTLWDSTVSDAELVEAARDAAILDDIMVRPSGFDSSLDEGGGNFSGGQRQRLEIARALTQNPSVLVLDEATSALDANTEKVIDDNLRRRGATCLIVAHRLSTIRDCDEILVLERGKVTERGTHEALVAANGAYARLIES